MREGLINTGLVNKLKIIQNLLQRYSICKDYPYSDSRASRIIPMLIDIENSLDSIIKNCKNNE